MSSPYPKLDNRTIDQWKVTELKEELKRRKLTTKGLKDDLIKRLNEAILVERENAVRLERENAERLERENAERLERENAERQERENAERLERENAKSLERENAKIIEGGGGKVNNGFDVNEEPLAMDAKNVVIDGSAAALNQGTIEVDYVLVDKHDAAIGGEELKLQSATVETTVSVTENVVASFDLGGQGSQNTEANKTNEDSKPQLENEDPEPMQESLDSKPQLENVDPKPQLESESLDDTPKDAMLNSSSPNYQVSEVSTVLGSEVKYDYISTDSVSINEKIELKDNIIADHVKIELDVKPEMVEPSSSAVVPVNGDSHPMDVEEPPESKASVTERDDNYDTNADISQKNDTADVGYSEKLNLERSSGDDSMEEDVLDSKQIDSKYNSDYVGEDRVEKTEDPIAMEDGHVDVVGDDISSEKVDTSVDDRNHPALPAEKRKLNDKSAVGTNEPAVKRRRWNSESLKVPESQNSIQTPTTTPKDTSQTPVLKHNFSRSNSTMSENILKERVVPPSQKPPTNSLKIDNFLRPFTLKAVQELLGKTGKFTDFWMDHIKTHCFVTYSSMEEAVETRNAVYNLQWPTNGGRLLVADFVDPQEVQARVQNPQTPVTPVSAPVAPSPSQHQPSPRLSRQQLQQKLPPPPSLPPPPPLSSLPPARERLPLPPPPPLLEKVDPPIVTLDDLFRKTKATPRIYYLPLSKEQVEAKLAAGGRNPKL
ncbi:uncharacterized protein LOC126790615 [Argentina anserina]|uniref:uncharacterized protein LOC126790615 n=1 Tax=Argentina anserina TaxID=57926 RepID=UPI002176584C|nr:uncharacterized protein LOC126790615 [Potentilla anserina]XP_050372896.1 uncharacterized protein LOC126790615 [Potentilla anserina]